MDRDFKKFIDNEITKHPIIADAILYNPHYL